MGFGATAATALHAAAVTDVPHGSSGATCPLGFGGDGSRNKTPTAASLSSRGLPRMPLAVLAAHHDPHPTREPASVVRLVSVKGVVFDVSDDEAFRSGGALARLPGHDVSRFVAVAVSCRAEPGEVAGRGDDGDGDDEVQDHCFDLDRGLEGLRYEEHRRLESYYVEMAQGRRAVAVLADEDYERWADD